MVSFMPLLLYPWGNSLGTHYIVGWVGPRISLGIIEKKKISCFYQELNPDSLVIQPIA
jgi:hypothetical protein